MSNIDVTPTFGQHITASAFDPNTDPQSNGQYKRLVYSAIKTKFYGNEDLPDEIAVISIPPDVYGEGIRPGSVIIDDTDIGRTYNDDAKGNLVSGQTKYGNVFYTNGVIVMTEDVVSGSTLYNFDIEFQSTQTIYENEVFLPVGKNEFNVSQNPTSAEYKEEDGESYILFDGIQSQVSSSVTGGFADYDKFGDTDPTGSFLSVYITSIGLYDDDGNMVAVAKLPRPVKKLPDYPLNFIVRFDT